VLMPDSAATSKEWPPERFADLANHIVRHTDYNVVVLGTRETTRHRFKQQALFTTRIQQRMGMTTPLEVLPIIQQAQAAVCNDSFGLHAATVMGTPVICLTNGGYYGRYWPYPDRIPHSAQHFVKVTDAQPTLADIPVEWVWQALEPYLSPKISSSSVMSPERNASLRSVPFS
jgi:ADP-heptose:LPS heptosyltransferase